MIPGILATACAGLFAGAAVYINLVQQPAIAALGTPATVRFFRPMYARAAPMQASLALVGSLAGLWAWWVGDSGLWLFGAILLAFVIPFTLIVIKPTNDRLKDAALDPASDEARDLLVCWSRLHGVRSLASVLSLLVFVIALAGN